MNSIFKCNILCLKKNGQVYVDAGLKTRQPQVSYQQGIAGFCRSTGDGYCSKMIVVFFLR